MAGLEGLYPDRLEYDDTDFGLVSFVAKISNGAIALCCEMGVHEES